MDVPLNSINEARALAKGSAVPVLRNILVFCVFRVLERIIFHDHIFVMIGPIQLSKLRAAKALKVRIRL